MSDRRARRGRGTAVLLLAMGIAFCPAISAAQSGPPASPEAQATAPGDRPSPSTDSINADPAATTAQSGATASPPAPAETEAQTSSAPPEPDVTPRPLRPPADPAAAAAYAVLDRHCARCHQGGRLERTSPAAGLGNILRLDEIAAAPHLVMPGNPDASRLYVSMLRSMMPLDVHTGRSSAPAPTSEEIAAVRSWIGGLPPRTACRDRRPVTPADLADALAKTAVLPGEDPLKLRFVSIAHLHNGCVRFEALAAYREAVARLFNSLSWKTAVVSTPAIDPARTLFKINLDDIGWLPEHWERIMRAAASPLGLVPPLPAEVRKTFGTAVPMARADWFAETVLAAPLYYDVLGLPGTGPEILKILQIDTARLSAAGSVARAPVQVSELALQPSLVERLTGPTGAFWQAYHRFGREGPGDLAAHAEKPAAEPVPHHVSRVMFTLPNGLPAFFMVGQRGDRLDTLPPDIALPTIAPQAELRGGLDCMACHAGGPVAPRPSGPPLPLPEARNADRKVVAAALPRLGISPDLKLDGVEPVVALAAEHSRPLDLARAAAELGIAEGVLVDLADKPDTPVTILARRLAQGLVARSEVEARSGDLRQALGLVVSDEAAPAGETDVKLASQHDWQPIDRGPSLVLYSDKARYRKGDLLGLVVRPSSDCHLTLVSIDQRGRGTVIFPSDFETSTLLTAGQELRLPGAGAPYSFRLAEVGRERIVALCNEAGSTTDGIRHDFERQRFTDLGNYATHLAQHATLDGSRKDAAPKPVETRQRGRRRPRAETVPDIAIRPEQIARTSITIVIEPAAGATP